MAKIAIIGLTGESIFMNLNQFPKVGETIRANSSYTEPGGKGYNQAVAASKLGAKVSFLSAVGNDTYGKECINTLNEYNIDHNIHIKENKRTSLATILTEKKGDNKVIVSPGASLDIEDVESFADKIKAADVLLMQLETKLSIIKKAIKIARKHKTYIILNPAPAANLDKEVLENVDLLTPNEIEAEAIFKLIDKNKCKAIITMGNKGAVILEDGKESMVPAYKVEAIDTTGAGDTFNGALAVEIAKGKSLKKAAEFANAAAALSVTKNYVINALPTRLDVESFIKKHKP